MRRRRTGLTFTDALPAGAVIGTPNGLVNGCGGTPTITAASGAGTIIIGGTGVNAAIGASELHDHGERHLVPTAGPYVNGAAEVTAIGGMLNGVTNQTLTVTQASLTKAFAPATISQGGVSTLTFTLANGAGNPAQSGINFTDTLPANVAGCGDAERDEQLPERPGAWSRRQPRPGRSRWRVRR